ncbi:MAG: amidohydrolase family protein [Parvularculaceae bacterium]
MRFIVRLGAVIIAMAALGACGRMEQSPRARPGDGAVIYQSTILTMDPERPTAEAVIIKDGLVLDIGAIDDLVQAYPGASFDERFLRRTLLPAFVDARLPPNALNVTEIACQGAILPEEIAALASGDAPARIVVRGPAALAAAVGAVRRLRAEGSTAAIAIEAGEGVDGATAGALTAAGVALVLSDPPAESRCGPEDGFSALGAMDSISGLIAIAPSDEDASLLAAASRYLHDDGPVRLSPQDALEAITRDAAYALGEDSTRGVIKIGRLAAFAALDRNPLASPAEAWGAIAVEIVEL